MYQCNIILLFLDILVSHNHTKTHALLFQRFLILLDLNRQFYCVCVLFIFSANTLSEFFFFLYDFLVIGSDSKQFLLASVVISLIFVRFLTFSIIFFENLIIHQLEKSFSNHFLHFLAPSSYQCIILAKLEFQPRWNIMSLCTFFNTDS